MAVLKKQKINNMDNIFTSGNSIFQNQLSNHIKKMAKEESDYKQKVLKDRLIKLGFSELAETILLPQAGRRFPRLLCEQKDNTESYWIDNGTPTGLLLARFTRVTDFKNDFGDLKSNKIVATSTITVSYI